MHLIARYARPYALRMAGGMLMKLIGAFAELLLPGLLAFILDEIIPLKQVSLVYLYGGLMLLCAVTAMLTNILANHTASAVSRDATLVLRHDLFEHIVHLKSSEIDRFTIPSLISRMTTDMQYVYRMLGMIQRIGVRAPILMLGGMVITLMQDAALSSLLIAMMPFMVLIVVFISKKCVPMYTRLQEYVDKLVRVVRENMTGERIIKALCKTEDEKKRFGEINQQVASSETKAAMVMSLNGPLMQFLLNMGLVLIIVIGAKRVDAGLSKPGNLIAFLSYFTMILNAMLTITRIITIYSKALASARRIDSVMQGETEEEEKTDEKISPNAPKVEFSNVSFSYNKKQNDVENISFRLEKGQHLGILGPTGAGKSTIIKLLMRFYDPDQGKILLDGENIKNMPLEKLRRKFGVVFQNDALFRGSIGENVTLGRKISVPQIEKALEDAQAQDFVTEKGGLESEVVSRGHNFSGGQQQRLFISRALAGNPDILVLDDASSALDFRTEANLRRTLRENYKNTTTVMIAQRISAVMHCDLILVVEDGEIKGLGNHKELMKNCPLYQEIASLQLGGEEDE